MIKSGKNRNEQKAIKYKVIDISKNSSLLENQKVPISITFIIHEKIYGKEGSELRPYFSADWQQQTICKIIMVRLCKMFHHWASLVAQWLRVCLPMQGTQVRALVWEDPTCHRATRPVSHNY